MITKFDKKTLTTLRPELEKRLKAIENELGITLKLGNCKFTDISANFSLECLVMSETGEKLDKRAEDFKRMAEMYGLQKEDLGKKIILNGVFFTITGLDSRPRVTKPVVITHDKDGTVYKVSVDTVNKKFGRE